MKWLQLVDQDTKTPDITVGGGAYLYGLHPIAKRTPEPIATPSKSSAGDETVTFDLHSPPKGKGKNRSSALIPLKKIMLHKWVHYKFPNRGLLITNEAKERYEVFCGGFLLFYDDIVRNAVVDHTIYLKWEEKSNAVHKNPKGIFYSSVTIYIDPEPERKKNKYKKIATLAEIPHILPSYGDTVDPPPPPPPPPPRF